MRCYKLKKQCPGYRDPLNVNENKLGRKKRSSVVSTASSSNDAPGSSRPRSGITTSKHLSVPIDEQALCYFLSNFVITPHDNATGHLSFMVPLMRSEQCSAAFSLSLSAVSIAALGRRPNSRGLLAKANSFYVKALGEINLALRDPELATHDSTLAAVVLLVFFETLTSAGGMKAWSSHMEGAIALVKFRGREQHMSQMGRDLFATVRKQAMAYYAASSPSIDYGVDWHAQPLDSEVEQAIYELDFRAAELRHETKAVIPFATRSDEGVEKVLRLLKRAQALQQAYADWIDSLPPSWRAGTAAWIEEVPQEKLQHASAYPGLVRSYRDITTAADYVSGLATRLQIFIPILRCVAWLNPLLDYKITPEYLVAARLSRQIIADIIASVPYFCGWSKEAESPSPEITKFHSADAVTAKGVTGMFIMAPIFTAATSDFVSSPQQTWLLGRLEYIENSMGISHAGLLASVLITQVFTQSVFPSINFDLHG
ncbi:hypothetical protein BP6252_10716 [Coleophoma cylindrospora]|uniref:Uncharacterized protein n=1 Tax=Coleophoma cylindrospora TaxID=1849047 RepID=A0A3D8QTF5_9HELO|nr:hypothetical protein BP6252_10716 [Coleophoma cylindrospora]